VFYAGFCSISFLRLYTYTYILSSLSFLLDENHRKISIALDKGGAVRSLGFSFFRLLWRLDGFASSVGYLAFAFCFAGRFYAFAGLRANGMTRNLMGYVA